MNNKQLTKEDVQKAIDAEYAKLENGSLKFHFKCCACCKAAIIASAGPTISAAITVFPDGSELIKKIAEAVDLSIEIITALIKMAVKEIKEGLKNLEEAVEKVVEEICKKLNQC